VWEAVQDSELVIYVTVAQLYRPELEMLKRIYESQIQWDKYSKTIGVRKLVVYVNKDDSRKLTMTSQIMHQEADLIRNQVSQWVSSNNVVFGSSSPISEGIRQPPQIESLEALINQQIND
jgi:hypothetical protein